MGERAETNGIPTARQARRPLDALPHQERRPELAVTSRLEDLPALLTPREVSISYRRSLSGVYEDIRSGPLRDRGALGPARSHPA